jgi:hypothetical protein
MIVWFLSLLLLMFCVTFIDLYMLNQPCILGMNQHSHSCVQFHVKRIFFFGVED